MGMHSSSNSGLEKHGLLSSEQWCNYKSLDSNEAPITILYTDCI